MDKIILDVSVYNQNISNFKSIVSKLYVILKPDLSLNDVDITLYIDKTLNTFNKLLPDEIEIDSIESCFNYYKILNDALLMMKHISYTLTSDKEYYVSIYNKHISDFTSLTSLSDQYSMKFSTFISDLLSNQSFVSQLTGFDSNRLYEIYKSNNQLDLYLRLVAIRTNIRDLQFITMIEEQKLQINKTNEKPSSMFQELMGFKNLYPKRVFKSMDPYSMAKDKSSSAINFGYLIIHKLIDTPIEYNPFGIIDKKYIDENKLNHVQYAGINDTIIERYKTIVELPKIQDAVKKQKLEYVNSHFVSGLETRYEILETLDDIKYRKLYYHSQSVFNDKQLEQLLSIDDSIRNYESIFSDQLFKHINMNYNIDNLKDPEILKYKNRVTTRLYDYIQSCTSDQMMSKTEIRNLFLDEEAITIITESLLDLDISSTYQYELILTQMIEVDKFIHNYTTIVHEEFNNLKPPKDKSDMVTFIKLVYDAIMLNVFPKKKFKLYRDLPMKRSILDTSSS